MCARSLDFRWDTTPRRQRFTKPRKPWADGAGEVDMVVNIGDVKNGGFARITREIEAVKRLRGAMW